MIQNEINYTLSDTGTYLAKPHILSGLCQAILQYVITLSVMHWILYLCWMTDSHQKKRLEVGRCHTVDPFTENPQDNDPSLAMCNNRLLSNGLFSTYGLVTMGET